LSDVAFESSQPLLERFQVSPHPHGTYGRGRNEDAALAPLVGNSYLSKRWLLKSKGSDRRFRGFFDSVTKVGLLPTGVDKRIHAAFGGSRLIAVESVARKVHHLAGTGHIIKFSSPTICLMTF
jgi:hypothetical protein